ncbi:hypothetical protein MHBO_002731 [Bonamia ostreae]|uniref:Uncharacterized protein n=1 Tax=Bonamia ostreae TaxID=126728 RepID=A0ABV2ANS3_9EUKA
MSNIVCGSNKHRNGNNNNPKNDDNNKNGDKDNNSYKNLSEKDFPIKQYPVLHSFAAQNLDCDNEEDRKNDRLYNQLDNNEKVQSLKKNLNDTENNESVLFRKNNFVENKNILETTKPKISRDNKLLVTKINETERVPHKNCNDEKDIEYRKWSFKNDFKSGKNMRKLVLQRTGMKDKRIGGNRLIEKRYKKTIKKLIFDAEKMIEILRLLIK